MAQGNIDVDRGVQIRQIVKFDSKNRARYDADLQYGGIFVYMYKDAPGVYYDVHGNTIPKHMAALAGYPVTENAKKLKLAQASAEFRENMRKALEIESEEKKVVLAEAGDWQVLQLPMGHATVVDKATQRPVIAVTMTEADAMVFLQNLTQTEEEAKVEDEANSSKGKA